MLAKGIHGARILGAAFAEIKLRKLGYVKSRRHRRGRANGKPWSEDEYSRAWILDSRGASLTVIAGKLKRSEKSVRQKLSAA